VIFEAMILKFKKRDCGDITAAVCLLYKCKKVISPEP
jgi:hypothetical protein